MKKLSILTSDLAFDTGRLEKRNATNALILHHTGNPCDDDCSAAQINASHQAQGWTCIGYHYVIRKDGAIEEGRPEWAVGAHAYGNNADTIGIHLCGNFEIAEPTPQQIESAALLIAHLCAKYNLPPDSAHVLGHLDLHHDTACPGESLYQKLQTIRGKAIWYQNN